MKDKKIEKKPIDYDYVLVILGDSNVGKTSVFRKIGYNSFEGKRISTIGIDKVTLSYEIGNPKKEFKMALIDTPGTEKNFQGEYVINFVKNSDAALLLYDITNKQSFENLDKWIKRAKEIIADKRNYTFFIMGTKKDLVESNKKKREVEANSAEAKCSGSKEDALIWAEEISSKELRQYDLSKKFEGFLEKISKQRESKKIKEEKLQEEEEKCCCFIF